MSKSILAFQDEYRFLSNFWPCDVRIGGLMYPSAEHAYQAQKTTDLHERMFIAQNLKSPGQAKRYGGGTIIQIRPDWDAVRLAVMHEVVTAKFTQNPDLAKLLVATGDRELIEGNSWGDRFWGKVDGQDRSLSGMLFGENWLGRILMITRSRIVLDQG